MDALLERPGNGSYQVKLMNTPGTALFGVIYGVSGTSVTYYPKVPAAAKIIFHPPRYKRINFNPPVTLSFRVRR